MLPTKDSVIQANLIESLVNTYISDILSHLQKVKSLRVQTVHTIKKKDCGNPGKSK